MAAEPSEDALRLLVDQYRDHCLWFLRRDYYPSDTAERLTVLGYIERYGDLEAYRKARGLREWLSRTSSAPSAA
jgi:hypothetical protein